MTGDLNLARKLICREARSAVVEKSEPPKNQPAEPAAARGRIESMTTSGLHLDILRDLKRINSHLALVAQPRLRRPASCTRRG